MRRMTGEVEAEPHSTEIISVDWLAPAVPQHNSPMNTVVLLQLLSKLGLRAPSRVRIRCTFGPAPSAATVFGEYVQNGNVAMGFHSCPA
jgi:hypothetical protein